MIHPADYHLLGLVARPAGSSARLGAAARGLAAWCHAATVSGRVETCGDLRLGLSCSLHWGYARRLVAELRRLRPDIILALTDTNEIAGVLAVQSETLDAAILTTSEVPEGLCSTELWRERLIVALPEDHRLAACGAVDPAQLEHETLLLAGGAEAQSDLEGAIALALRGVSVTVQRAAVERDTLFDLVALGFGLTVAPSAATGALYPGVAFRPLTGPHAEVGFHLLWRPDSAKAAVDAFTQLAQDFSRATPLRAVNGGSAW